MRLQFIDTMDSKARIGLGAATSCFTLVGGQGVVIHPLPYYVLH